MTFPVGSAVDTGIIAYPRVFEWEMTIRVPSSLISTGNIRIGTWDNTAGKSIMVWIDTNNQRKFDIIEGNDYRFSNWSAIQDKFGKIGYDGTSVFCGENHVAVDTSFSVYVFGSTPHFGIFGLNGYAGGTTADCDLADAKFTFNGITIREFVPVRMDGAAYLYDKVTQQFFSSVSEVALVAGPDKI